LVDKDLSITGYFNVVQPEIELLCGDVMLYIQSDGVAGSQAFTDLSSHSHPITLEGKQDIEYSTNESLFGENSIWFNGSNGTQNYLSVDTGSLTLGTDDFTIEFWVKTGKDYYYKRIFSQSEGSISVGGDYLNPSLDAMILNDGRLMLRTEAAWASSTKITTAHVVGDNIWHHIAMVRGSSLTSIYVDGQLSTSTTSADFLDDFAETNFHIGDLPVLTTSKNFSLNGYLGGFRVAKKALYIENFIPPTNLIHNPC
jgi:hypothetical protein